MRVALVMPSLDIGGVERVMLNLAKGLLQNDLAVDLVVSDTFGPLRQDVPHGVQLVDLRASKVLRSMPGLIKYLHKYKPSAVISAKDYQNIIVLWAIRLTRLNSITIVSTHIDVSVEWRQIKGVKASIIPFLVRWCYRWADYITTVSYGARDSLVKVTGLPEEKIRVVYNPVVDENLLVKAKEPVKHPWFTSKTPVILSAGRLVPQKDYTTLIRAFALVREQRPARLIILGEGGERPVLHSLVQSLGLEKDVDLPGAVKNPYSYMSRAAVFVLSSRYEGLPVALIEALACGCPVVSTDCPSGPAEILEGGKWGSLVPVGDINALSQAILQVLESPPDRDLLRLRGLEFSVDRAVQGYLSLIEGRLPK